MTENYLILILLALVLILVTLAIAVVVLLWKVLGAQKEIPPTASSQTTAAATPKVTSLIPDPTLSYCVHHPEEQAHGVCALSSDPICERCIREHDGLIISFEHFQMFLATTWASIETVLTTPDATEASAHLYLMKKQLWSKNQTPTYISTHYKINVTEDIIESHVSLFVREQEQDELKELLESFRQEIKKDKP